MKLKNYTLILLLFLFSCKKDSTVQNPGPPAPPLKSSEKKITAFKFSSTQPEAIGVIDETNKKITVNVAYGTVVSSIQPVISVSEKAWVNNTASADFSKVVIYKVTAEDGTTQDYQVITTVSNPKFSVEAYTGPTELEAGNGSLLLKGKGFGTDASKVQLILTNTSGQKTTISMPALVTDVSIGLTIPETLALGNYSVQLIVDGELVPLPVILTIVQAAPIIDAINGTSLNQSETLTINGRFFAIGNKLEVIFKSKTTGATFSITPPNGDLITSTPNKIEIRLANFAGGTYTYQVKSNQKLSATKDLEVIAPVVIKPIIVEVGKTVSSNKLWDFGYFDVVAILTKNISISETRPTVRFVSLNTNSIYVRTGWISSRGMSGSEIKYQFTDFTIPSGTYKIVIESEGKSSDPSERIITVR